MKKTLFFFFTTLLCFNVILKSQTLHDSISSSYIENAQYLKGNLTEYLQKNIKYPLEALEREIQGDVILSINIDKNGSMNSLKIVSSQFDILSTSSIASLDYIENKWSPYKVNGTSVSKNYLVVFRYRFYLNTQLPEYKERAENFVEKQKYDKALKFYNIAIKENRFDYELFESRSKVKEMLGDSIGANSDSQQSDRLKNEIISVVNIVVMAKTEKRIETRIETRVIH